MSKGSRKGANFERQIARMLSLWWSEGKRDDIFWRTPSSGARATIRQRQGKSTAGQYGDIRATDPIGEPLLRACTIEVKTGYKDTSIMDLLDRKPHEKPKFLQFIQQARQAAQAAQTPCWMLIVRRLHKQTMIFLPTDFTIRGPTEFDEVYHFRQGWMELWSQATGSENIFGVRLEEFFTFFTPKQFMEEFKSYGIGYKGQRK